MAATLSPSPLHQLVILSTLILLLGFPSPTILRLASSSPVGLHFNYRSFADTRGQLLLQGNATLISGGPAGLWLTPATSQNNTDPAGLINLIGRVVHRKPLLVPPRALNCTNLRTQLTFRLVTNHTSYGGAGDGLAFFLASALDIPLGSEGEFLGVDNRWVPASRERFFAVEFDTFKNSYDPSVSHIGIDVNSIESIATVDTSQPESPLNLYGGYVFRAWIEYDASDGHRISVWLDNCSQSKKACSKNQPSHNAPLLAASYDLSTIIGGGDPIYVGISAANGVYHEGAVIYSWSFDARYV